MCRPRERRGGGQRRPTERRDGYRGSSAIIGAESRFFSTTDIDLGEAVRIRGTSIPCDSQRRPAARCITAHRATRGTTSARERETRKGGQPRREEGTRLEDPPPVTLFSAETPPPNDRLPPPDALSNPLPRSCNGHNCLSPTPPVPLDPSRFLWLAAPPLHRGPFSSDAVTAADATTTAVATTLRSIRQGRASSFAALGLARRFLGRSSPIGTNRRYRFP